MDISDLIQPAEVCESTIQSAITTTVRENSRRYELNRVLGRRPLDITAKMWFQQHSLTLSDWVRTQSISVSDPRLLYKYNSKIIFPRRLTLTRWLLTNLVWCPPLLIFSSDSRWSFPSCFHQRKKRHSHSDFHSPVYESVAQRPSAFKEIIGRVSQLCQYGSFHPINLVSSLLVSANASRRLKSAFSFSCF